MHLKWISCHDYLNPQGALLMYSSMKHAEKIIWDLIGMWVIYYYV